MLKRKTVIEPKYTSKNKISIVTLKEKCLLKWKSKTKKKSVNLSEIYFIHMTSHLCQVIGIYTAFSCVNCKLSILWIYIIFSALEGPSYSFSFGMTVRTPQFKGRARHYRTDKMVPWKVYALESHLKFTIFLVPYSRNRDNCTCPFQKAVTKICQWPPNTLGLRSTNEDRCSSKNVHYGLFVWYRSALRNKWLC